MNEITQLFDTTIWIDFLKNKPTKEVELLDKNLSNGIILPICPPIYQEVLQGLRFENEIKLVEYYFGFLEKLTLNFYFVADEAAKLYRNLRRKGVTIRKPNDCIIAIYALEFNLEIVHNDSDFDLIAANSSLKIFKF